MDIWSLGVILYEMYCADFLVLVMCRFGVFVYGLGLGVSGYIGLGRLLMFRLCGQNPFTHESLEKKKQLSEIEKDKAYILSGGSPNLFTFC